MTVDSSYGRRKAREVMKDEPKSCYFCNKGGENGDWVVHHINRDETDNKRENLAWSHRSCNSKFHSSGNEFLCPEEGCRALFGDWPSLQKHLADEHGVEATLAQYNQSRVQAGLKPLGVKAEADMGMGMGREHGQSGESHVRQPSAHVQSVSQPMSVKPFVCPECGKGYDKWKSLMGHGLGAHRIRFKEADFVPAGGGEEASRKLEKPREDGISIPDPYSHLKQMLVTFGVSDKNSAGVVKFMEPYSVDDLYKLIEVSAEYMPRSRLKLFVESWCNVRRIPIPPEIERELGISIPEQFNYRRPYQRYGRYDRREPEPKDDVSRQIDQQFDEMRKISLIRAMQSGDDDEKNQALTGRVRQLERELAQREGELAEVKQRDMFRELIREEVQPLRDELKDLLSRGEDLQKMLFAKSWVQDASGKVISFLELEETPPSRGRGSPSSIASLLPDEYLEIG